LLVPFCGFPFAHLHAVNFFHASFSFFFSVSLSSRSRNFQFVAPSFFSRLSVNSLPPLLSLSLMTFRSLSIRFESRQRKNDPIRRSPRHLRYDSPPASLLGSRLCKIANGKRKREFGMRAKPSRSSAKSQRSCCCKSRDTKRPNGEHVASICCAAVLGRIERQSEKERERTI
jgi:hypothetical protein